MGTAASSTSQSYFSLSPILPEDLRNWRKKSGGNSDITLALVLGVMGFYLPMPMRRKCAQSPRAAVEYVPNFTSIC